MSAVTSIKVKNNEKKEFQKACDCFPSKIITEIHIEMNYTYYNLNSDPQFLFELGQKFMIEKVKAEQEA